MIFWEDYKMKYFIDIIACEDENCTKDHNENGHHYGCGCNDCMMEYWSLKH